MKRNVVSVVIPIAVIVVAKRYLIENKKKKGNYRDEFLLVRTVTFVIMISILLRIWEKSVADAKAAHEQRLKTNKDDESCCNNFFCPSADRCCCCCCCCCDDLDETGAMNDEGCLSDCFSPCKIFSCR